MRRQLWFAATLSALVALSLTIGVASALAQAPVGFSGPTNFAAGDGPASVAVGDFNGDSDPDLAVANAFSNNVSVLLGAAGGGLTGATNFAVGTFPFSVAVGDFNGDGDPDLGSARPAAASRARPPSRSVAPRSRSRWATSTATTTPTSRSPTS